MFVGPSSRLGEPPPLRTKIGYHSVNVTKVVCYADLQPPMANGQNAITRTVSQVLQDHEFITVAGDNVTLGSSVNVPNLISGNYRVAIFQHTFIRTHPSEVQPLATHLVATSYPDFPAYTDTDIAELSVNGRVNIKNTITAMDPSIVGRDFATALAASATLNMAQCDYTAPFTCCYIFADMMVCQTADAFEFQAPQPNQPFPIIQTAIAGDLGRAQAQLVINQITNNPVAFRRVIC